METTNNNPLPKRHNKDTEKKGVNLNPQFNDLHKPETIKNHVQELTKKLK